MDDQALYEESTAEAPVGPMSDEAWHMDCSEYLIGETEEETKELRKLLSDAHFWSDGWYDTNRINVQANRVVALAKLGEHLYKNLLKSALEVGEWSTRD